LLTRRVNVVEPVSSHVMQAAMTPLFIATETFGPSDGAKWRNYIEWAKIPHLMELVSLDGVLCRRLVCDLKDQDWKHIVNEDFRLGYFYDLDYLMKRVAGVAKRNILGLYRNPGAHIFNAPATDFVFLGYDLIEDQTQISALTNCGGFPASFSNDELNRYGLVQEFDRAKEIGKTLVEQNPEDPHADCELYAIWRLVET
jgi:hypothetical protein